MLNLSGKLIHVVAGPTGSGKTQLALALAQQLNGELVSADSRQIYIGMDIGTNKGELVFAQDVDYGLARSYPLYVDSNSKIPIHLLSFLTPDQTFSVAEFQKLAFAVIADFISRNKVPILVGGTGLYISSIIAPGQFRFGETAVDAQLRHELSSLSTTELQQRAHSADAAHFSSLNSSDRTNPRRLIRLIERARAAPGDIASWPTLEVVKHYVDKQAELDLILRERVAAMWEMELVDEVKALLSSGYTVNSPGLAAPGYQEVMRYLDGAIDISTCQELIFRAHRQYAKRQRTWFKKYFV